MEFDLQRLKREGYRLSFDTVITREETMESIIPDSLQDAKRIICADGVGYLLSKQVGEGTVRINGTACVTVLYQPDGEQLVCAVPLNIPFQCTLEDGRINEGLMIHAEVLSVCAAAQLTNPRKMLVKFEVHAHLIAYSYFSCDFVCDLAEQDRKSIQKKWNGYKDCMIGTIVEKPFGFSDLVRPTGGKVSIDELLSWGIAPGPMETKYIGKKLITKGELILSMCYRMDQQILSGKYELPYSQIIDIEGSFEEGEPQSVVALQNAVCRLENGELEVSVEAVLQAALWSQHKMSLLCDVYSTETVLDTEKASCAICTSAERIVHRQNYRKFCESTIAARNVIRSNVYLRPLIMQKTDDGFQYKTSAEVSILYFAEDDSLCSVDYTIPVTFTTTISEMSEHTCSCKPVGDAVAIAVTGGFEVRIELEFVVCVAEHQTVSNVTAIHKNDATMSDVLKPSAVLRIVNNGEDLWDIAKSCRSTVDDICAVNQIPGGMPEPGTVLLIPVHR